MSQTKFDQFGSSLTNPFAKNCNTNTNINSNSNPNPNPNKSRKHINNRNQSFNTKPRAAYSAIENMHSKQNIIPKHLDTYNDNTKDNDKPNGLETNNQMYK
jgi:hypothetical protein